MKAISLWQPWASLIANGAKKIETRSWPTNYRGPILIHAAKRMNKSELLYMACNWSYCEALGLQMGGAYARVKELPFGAIVAVADLVDCVPVLKLTGEQLDVRRTNNINPHTTWSERFLGNYEPGRFGWVLENVKALDAPYPYKGEQGLFVVPDSLLPLSAY